MSVFVLCPTHATCPAHHMLRDLIPRITSDGEYNWWRYSLYSLRYSHRKLTERSVFQFVHNVHTLSSTWCPKRLWEPSHFLPYDFYKFCSKTSGRSEHKLARASVCSTSRLRRQSHHADSEGTLSNCRFATGTVGFFFWVKAFAYVFLSVLRQRNVIVPRGSVNPCNK